MTPENKARLEQITISEGHFELDRLTEVTISGDDYYFLVNQLEAAWTAYEQMKKERDEFLSAIECVQDKIGQYSSGVSGPLGEAILDAWNINAHALSKTGQGGRNRLKEERDSLKAELEQAKQDLSTKLQRTVSATYYALLEMSAWMGIPEKKREKQIEVLMENVRYCADHDLRELDESQRNAALKAENEKLRKELNDYKRVHGEWLKGET